MIKPTLAFFALLMFSSSSQAGEPFDVHGLITGNEGARYVKGIPTLDLEQQRGAIQLRSLGFSNNRPVFAIAFFNGGTEPVNIGLEDIHVTANGAPIRVFSVQELERQAKRKAWWSQFGLALLGGLAAGAAASQRSYSSGTITGPYGTYSIHTSYPSLAGQLQASSIRADTSYGIAAIRYQLDRTIEIMNNHVVQRTTVDPGSSYAGLIVLDKLKTGRPPYDLRVNVDWNGERYPFAYLAQKRGQPVPNQYVTMLAANSKPKPLSTRTFAREAVTNASQNGSVSSSPSATPAKVAGAIFLRSGAVKIPAKTPSGYCLRAPQGYASNGSKDYPVINGYLPRCPETVE